MALTRNYKLNMPHLLWGGLSENWLLKELGDAHWQQITSALNTASDQLADSRGERLYASFVRLKWTGDNISDFSENDEIELDSKLSRYGSKMFFSDTTCEGASKKMKAKLVSVFSTREASDNKKLKKGSLSESIDSGNIKLHSKLPAFAKEYLERKTEIFDENGKVKSDYPVKVLYRQEYTIDAYDDINGVGLLYFASYPKISDKCEREYMHYHYDFNGDWLECAGVISRDIHYYANANPGEKLIYELNTLEEKSGNVKINCSLYRVSDNQLMAKIATTKKLSEGTKLKKVKAHKKLAQVVTTSTNKKVENYVGNGEVTNAEALTNLDKITLNNIVINFFENILDVKGLKADTDLSVFGIESIIYQELSEFLYDKHDINSNPSRFYGTSTINELTDYLLGVTESSNYKETKVPNSNKTESEAVAIVGVSGRFPGAENINTFWENLKENKNSITQVPLDRWDWKTKSSKNPESQEKSKWGGFIDGVGEFDPLFFGISPLEAELMDPQQRITLQAVFNALEDANIVPSHIKGTNTGVYVGVSGSDYAHLLRETRQNTTEAYDAIGTATSILANRISYLLDIHGPSQAIDTACSSSLVALHEAFKSVKNGTCKVAIAGGVHTMLRPDLTVSYAQAGMLSKDGKCKTFDESANGYVRGEGIGIVVLKSLEEAIRDGNHIYAVIKGSSVNHGGKANTLTSPNPEAQKALLIGAYNEANVNPQDISYIEAHGTGTPLGDPIEIEGLKLAFKELFYNKNLKLKEEAYCGLGSVKTNIGHLEAAAGIAGLIKVLLCMQHQTLPGNPNLITKNKYINLEHTPFYLRKETSTWETKNKKRIAGVSSFGFGGVNAHVVLEEYKHSAKKEYKSKDPLIIVLSAKNKDRLKNKIVDLSNYLEKNNSVNVYDFAYTLQYGREEMDERLAFVANNLDEIKDQINRCNLNDYSTVFTGNAKKENCDFLLQGEAGKAYLDIAISKKEYELLAQLWVKGGRMNWDFLYKKNQKPSKIKLPTYPFAKQNYWVAMPSESIKENNSDSIIQKDALIEHNQVSVSNNGVSIKDKVSVLLMSLLQKVLKLEEKDIDFTADVSDYGIDSIMSSLMINELKEIIPDVPPLLFLEHKTFNDIVAYLIEDFSENFKDVVSDSPKVITNDSVQLNNQDKSIDKPELEVNELGNSISSNKKQTDLAIIGVSGILPKSNTIFDFFEHVKEGHFLTEDIPKKRLDLLGLTNSEKEKLQQFHGGFIDDIENFDYENFNFSKEEALQIDPQLRKLIETVYHVIGDSGYTIKNFQKQETGVFVATIGHSGYVNIMRNEGYNYEVETPTLYANRISHVFNLKGPSEVVDTACSSFIAALHRASHAIQRGDCKQAVVATATLNLSYNDLIKEDITGILSKQNKTKSFSEDADGFVRSETIGAVIVKPLEEAKKDGDYIYGIIKGIGVYHGGKSPLKWNSPNIKGQKRAIENAIEQAQIDPVTVDYIEAEANGVSFVDTSEMVSIQSVYGSYFDKSQTNKTIYIGSLKPLMGHAEASSTFPCLMKLITSVKEKRLYGVKGLTDINKGITLKEHFTILNSDINWETNLKRMAINCLGIGGVNTHLIFEEYIENGQFFNNKASGYTFVFSDESEPQLSTMLQKFSSYLPLYKNYLSEQELLNRLEYTLIHGRESKKYRFVVFADTLSNLLNSIAHWLDYNNTNSDTFSYTYNKGELLKIDTSSVNDAIKKSDWKLVFTYWSKGASINWNTLNYMQKSQKLPLPSPTLKTSYCWPFELSPKVEKSNEISKNDFVSETSFFDLIDGQTESPYKLEDDFLFLFDLKWREAYLINSSSNNAINHHVIACYLDHLSLVFGDSQNVCFDLVNNVHSHNANSFTALVEHVFLYVKNVLKQKPKNKTVIQIILPLSCIDTCYGLTGFIHSFRQESTKVIPQLIFVEDDVTKDELLQITQNNASVIDSDLIIKYQNGQRFVEYCSPSNILKQPINLKDTYKKGEVILITGGLGGIGLLISKDIIKYANNATIVLSGRSELNELRKSYIQELNKGKCKVVYYQSDISEENQVEALINTIVEDHGSLTGIMHCAGVTRDNYIMKKTVEEIETVFKPKVNGAEYLDNHTKHLQLRFFICFSSLHALGNAGQVDYAMANAFLDGFVRHRNKEVKTGNRQGHTIALNWPYWEEGGMQISETQLELMTVTKGSKPMSTQMGTYLLHYALQKSVEQVFVDFGDYQKIVKQHNIKLNGALVL